AVDESPVGVEDAEATVEGCLRADLSGHSEIRDALEVPNPALPVRIALQGPGEEFVQPFHRDERTVEVVDQERHGRYRDDCGSCSATPAGRALGNRVANTSPQPCQPPGTGLAGRSGRGAPVP